MDHAPKFGLRGEMRFWMEAMLSVQLRLCKCVPIGNDLVRLACIKCTTKSVQPWKVVSLPDSDQIAQLLDIFKAIAWLPALQDEHVRHGCSMDVPKLGSSLASKIEICLTLVIQKCGHKCGASEPIPWAHYVCLK